MNEIWTRAKHDAAKLELLREKTAAKPTEHPPALPRLDLPTTGEVSSALASVRRIPLGASLSTGLTALSAAEGVTVGVTVLAGFVALVHRFTDAEDIVVGMALRPDAPAELGGAIGPCAVTLLLRADLSGPTRFRDLIARMVERMGDSPPQWGEEGEAPQLQFADELLEAESSSENFSDEMDVAIATADLTLSVHASADELVLVLTVRHNIANDFADSFASSLRTLLDGAVRDPAAAITTLPLLNEIERTKILVEWNHRADRPLVGCVHEYLEGQAARTPNAIALSQEGEHLTYRMLDQRANRLAHRLTKLGVGAEVLVGIHLEPCLDQIVFLFAVLKAGGGYVPLDPTLPKEKLAVMLADSRPHLILTSRHLAASLPTHTSRVVCPGSLDEPDLIASPRSGVGLRNVACVLYTSGSTGTPKGVIIEHAGLMYRGEVPEPEKIDESDTLLLSASISWSFSLVQVFPALVCGARLVLPRDGGMKDPGYVSELIAREGITVLKVAPSMLAMLLDQGGINHCRSLKLAITSTESLSKQLQDRFLARLPWVTLFQASGQTEGGGTMWRCRPGTDGETIPVGYPWPNVRTYVLDRRLQPVPVGVRGELYIGSDALARGYLNAPEFTAEKFLADPFSDAVGARMWRTGSIARQRGDGALELLGRDDGLVKIRGFRVEVGEIEAVLGSHPSIREVAVVAREDDLVGMRLVAYVVLIEAIDGLSSVLREFVRKRLPDYMVPAVFLTLDALPRNANWKIDRKALPAPNRAVSASGETYVAPTTSIERIIAAAWAEVLGIERVGVQDNFFELGGHSLLLVKVFTKLRERLPGVALSITDMLEHTSVSRLAAFLSGSREPAKGVRGRNRTAASADPTDSQIAIVGMSCRFPGAKNLDEFWRNLRDGVESTRTFSDEELRSEAVDEAIRRSENFVRTNPVLNDEGAFDAAFFGMSPRESAITEPAHRLFLECAWEGLENAGYDPKNAGNVGVFAGSGQPYYTWLRVHPNLELMRRHNHHELSIASSADYLATRLSYKLNLTGPSVSIQTACSTSLVATIMACRSLLNLECDMALAGGASVRSLRGYLYSEEGIYSRDGHCRAFDAEASGTVVGDGVGVVVLKRLSDALAAGDPIHAIIRGLGLNNDGADKVGFTAPSMRGQIGAISEALATADVHPDTVTYVETHGTGTPLGDPIEISALTRAFREHTSRKGFCAVGSVKTNIGHLIQAAGVAGLIKTVLALKNGQIPPSLNFGRPNPEIDFANSPFAVNTSLAEWKSAGPRRAGVSSFGIGGTNAHVILEEAPRVLKEPKGSAPELRARVLPLSGRNAKALNEQVSRYARHLAQHPELGLDDVSHTAGAGRTHFEHRLAVVAATREDLRQKLEAIDRGEDVVTCRRGVAAEKPTIAFMFTGQGSQYPGMGRRLFDTEPVFRRSLERCASILDPLIERPLLSVLYPKEGETSPIDQTAFTQPALFAFEYALSELWHSWGIAPDAVIGHSVGEYVAACVAGIFTLEDGLKIVAARGRLMQALPAGGIMIALRAREADVRDAIAPFGSVSIAAINAPDQVVISGSEATVRRVAAMFDKGVHKHTIAKQLAVSHAFHSPLMAPIVDEFEKVAESIRYRLPRVPIVSNVTGREVHEEMARPGYWARHILAPVRFADGVAALANTGVTCFLEIGPNPSLLSPAQMCLPDSDAAWLPSLKRLEQDTIEKSLGELYVRGARLDWSAISPGRRVALPTYPFQRERYWIERQSARRTAEAGRGPLLQGRSRPAISCRSKQAEEAGLRGQGLDPTENSLHIVEWRPAALLDVTADPTQQQWLLVDNGGAVAAALAARIGKGALIASNPVCVEQVLTTKGTCLTGAVLFFEERADTSPAEEAQRLSVLALEGIKSLVRHTDGASRIFFVTRGASSLASSAVALAASPLLGLVRVLRQERPELTATLIDLEPGFADPAKEVEFLLSELGAQAGEPEVAYRGGQRLVPRLVSAAKADSRSMATPKHVGKIAPAKTSGVVRGDATYLITGGLGGLGLHVSRWLVAKGATHLVLIGRGRPSEAAQAAISALESVGARITVAAVDVSQRGPLEAVLAAIPEATPLRGVVHAAGVLDDGILTDQTSERFERVMAPKVLGAWNLHELTKERPLDFFVLFSSVAALMGSAGQSSYAAANAFLDALAARRHAQGLPGLSIGWGGWSGGGMLARLDEASRRRLERQAFEPFTPELGLAHFERALALGRPHVGAFLLDKRRLEAKFAGGEAPTLLRDIGAAPMARRADADIVAGLTKLEPREREAQLRAALQEEAAKVLGFSCESDVASERPLAELGLDSLMAIEFRNRVAKRIGRSLPARFAFEYPTLERQAQFLLQLLQLGVSERTEPLACACTSRGDSRQRISPLKTSRAFEWLELDKIDFFLDGDSIVAELEAREEYGGHGKVVFGGITALLTDFVSPFVSIGLLAGKTFVTTELTVGFETPIICGEKLTIRAHIEHVDTQRATIRVNIYNKQGRAATATNKVRFVSLRAIEQFAATDGVNG